MKARIFSITLASLLMMSIAQHSLAGSFATLEDDEPVRLSVSLPDGKARLALSSGQIIVTDSGGPTAVFFSLFSKDFSPFVHAGIIVLEEGKPFVYETYGVVGITLGGRPTDFISGQVSRTPLGTFVQRGKYVEVYDPPAPADPEKIAAYAVAQYEKGTPFDPYFRFNEHQALYCTEFVALAIEAAGGEPVELDPFTDNPSLHIVRHWLGIDDTGTVQARRFIHKERLVGSLSIVSSQARFPLYIELKREIHRRFTPDQKLGNIFAWKQENLEFRQPIIDFMTRGLYLYANDDDIPGLDQLALDVRKLADEMFGAITPHASPKTDILQQANTR